MDEAYGTEKSKWSENGFSNVLERCFDGDGITNFIFVKNKLFPATIFIYKYCLFLGGEEILFMRRVKARIPRHNKGDIKADCNHHVKNIQQQKGYRCNP